MRRTQRVALILLAGGCVSLTAFAGGASALPATTTRTLPSRRSMTPTADTRPLLPGPVQPPAAAALSGGFRSSGPPPTPLFPAWRPGTGYRSESAVARAFRAAAGETPA